MIYVNVNDTDLFYGSVGMNEMQFVYVFETFLISIRSITSPNVQCCR